MSTQNLGNQTIVHQYFEEITGEVRGKRQLDIIPTGIYSGGYFTKVNNSEITLSPFVLEIKDNNNQVSIRSAVAATLNNTTIEEGSISSATPFIIARWAYAETALNYLSILAINSLTNKQANDLVIGKCVFSGSTLTGFDYTYRSYPNTLEKFLKVEASTGLYVWLRGGKVQTASGFVAVPDQNVGPFTVPSSPNSRIDLVYINSAGAVQIQQGTAGTSPVAPNYLNKMVLAEITVVNGDTGILATRIKDVRAFLTPSVPVIADNSITSTKLKTYDSGWFAVSVNTLYTKSHSLGSVPFMIQVWFSDTADGTGDVVQCDSPAFDYAPSKWNYSPLHIVDSDISSIQISSSGILIHYTDKNRTDKALSTGYARIKAIG